MAAIQHSNSSRWTRGRVAQIVAMLLTSVTMAPAAPAVVRAREQVVKIVTQIQRADYEGDRSALKRLHGALAPFVENKDLAARVRYWRGFALWRRAINGFNDHVDPTELQEDLKHALDEFDDAARKDPTFGDAKIGALSCIGFFAYSVHQQDPGSARIQELIPHARQLRKEAEAEAPENPRLLWVLGPMVWNTPAERGGGQAKAMEQYEKGLAVIRSHKTTPSDPLEPAWGEPELLMSLAWSNLNRTTPDLNAAEQDARSALELVPYWHYVRDILMPQIRDAREKTELKNGDRGAARSGSALEWVCLAPRRVLLHLGHLDAMRGGFIAGNPFIQRLRDLLAIGFALQIAFIGGAADKGNFRENCRHGGAGQHEELRILDAAVTNAGAVCRQRGV